MASTIVPYLFLLAFLVLPPSTIAKSYKNISLGSTLTTSDVTNFWPSPSGEFAFGFQKIGNGSSGFLLAIWFNKLKEKTIVWSANRDIFAPDGSKIQLSMDGRLVLTDPNGQEIWARGELGAGPAYGAMLDTGNFVLATTSISSATQWQTFDEPTDTILPGQVLNRRTRCECPLGYILNDPNDKLGNCKPNFPEQDCKNESRDVEAFTIHEMPNTNWFGGDYASYLDGTVDSCRQNCLSDCYCALAVYYPGVCWKKRYPLLNGRADPAEGGKALLKIGKDNSTVGLTTTTTTTTPQSQDGEKRKNQSSLIISVSVLLCSSVFILMLLAFLYVFKFKGKKPKKISPYQVVPGVNIRCFSYNKLEEATNGFEEVLGTGAFSTVYKAVLNDENGKIVAVKKLHKTVTEGEEGFQAEVNSISRTNHKNLVQLLGFCNEGQHRLLVYEHMKNGSLADLLFKDSRLNWSKRVQVAIDTAKGLCYFHEECRAQIIHCDIKPQNVLLDESLTANIADFGIAKLLGKDQTRTTTKVRGTRGYVAPEWFRNTAITIKVDVYSFGILLLELICCRKSYKQDVANENEMILAEWACDCYRRNELHLLAGDDEEAIEDIMRFEKLLMVAIWCIQENPTLRPSMKNVMLMLEGSVEVSIPPDPFSFFCSV